jgi:trehalose-6-phosphate synthase
MTKAVIFKGDVLEAREYAKKFGAFMEIDVLEIESSRGFCNALSVDPPSLIIRGFPKSRKALARIKAITSHDKMVLKRGTRVMTTAAPRLIFQISDYSEIVADEEFLSPSRFDVEDKAIKEAVNGFIQNFGRK